MSWFLLGMLLIVLHPVLKIVGWSRRVRKGKRETERCFSALHKLEQEIRGGSSE